MNLSHLDCILDKFNITSAKRSISPIYGSRGGSCIWRINIENEDFAIKQLSPEIDLTNPVIIAAYECSETIASLFAQQKIPAIVALGKADNRLTIVENTGYLLYQWMEGHTLRRNEVSTSSALQIANIVARIHAINLNIPEAKAIRFDVHDNDFILQTIEEALACGNSFAKSLKEKQKFILDLNDNFRAAFPILKERSVVTHGDIDQLNIIWNKKEEPFLIDWESARNMNPAHELIRTAFRFSGGGTNNFSLPLFTEMLHVYKQAGGFLDKHHTRAAIHTLHGSTINWMLYNIRLACHGTPERRGEASYEMDGILETIIRSQTEIPKMLALKLD